MAQQTRADLQTTINTNVNDNSNGDISALDVRSALTNLNDSTVNKATDTGFLGLYPYDVSRTYYLGQIVQYDYKWYSANTTTTPGAFNAGQWNFISYVEYSKSITIEFGNVLTLFDTPVLALAAVASRVLRVRNVTTNIIFNSIAYATNTTIEFYTDTATLTQFSVVNFLAATVSRSIIGKPTVTTPSATDTQLITNKGLYVRVPTGNPTAGNSSITISFDYTVES